MTHERWRFLRKDEGERLTVLGKRMRIKARAEDTDGRFSVWEQTHPRGYEASPHVHREAVEAMYVLAGTYDFSLGDERFRASPGSFLLVPAMVPHAFTAGPDGGAMLVLFAPGGYERYWEELRGAEKDGTLDPQLRRELAAKHGAYPQGDPRLSGWGHG